MMEIERKTTNNEDCVICMEALEPIKTIDRLQCGHTFHSQCIQQWQKENKACPLCRNNIIIIKASNPMYHSWHQQTKIKLKQRIKSNITRRANTTALTINQSINTLIHDHKCNHILSTVSFFSQLKQTPPFEYTFQIIESSLTKFNQKIDQWKGLSASQFNNFDDYYNKSLVWYCYKEFQWMADYLFYPLLRKALFKHINNIIRNCDSMVSIERTEFEQNIYRKLLYFTALKAIMNAKVPFPRHKPNPLIRNMSYKQSKKLSQFLEYLGKIHSVKCVIPINVRLAADIGNYVREWVDKVYRKTENEYNKEIMTKGIETAPKDHYTMDDEASNALNMENEEGGLNTVKELKEKKKKRRKRRSRNNRVHGSIPYVPHMSLASAQRPQMPQNIYNVPHQQNMMPYNMGIQQQHSVVMPLPPPTSNEMYPLNVNWVNRNAINSHPVQLSINNDWNLPFDVRMDMSGDAPVYQLFGNSNNNDYDGKAQAVGDDVPLW